MGKFPRIVAARAFTHTFRIDGRIRGAKRTEPADKLDSMLDPDAIAANYWNVCGNRAALWLGKCDCGLGPKFSSWTQLFSGGPGVAVAVVTTAAVLSCR